MSAPLPRHSKTGMEVEPTILAEPDTVDADSLVSSNDPDDLGNEQTWPTEEEMKNTGAFTQSARDGELPDAVTGTTPKTVRRIPKGMSEYQAAWIIDEDDEDEGEVGEASSEVEMEPMEEEEMVDMPMLEDDMATESRRSVAFQDLDVEEEEKQWVFIRLFMWQRVDWMADSIRGAIASGRRKMTSHFQTRLIHRRRSLRVLVSSAIVGCGPSGQAHGTHLRICPEITLGFSNLRTLSAPNAACAVVRSERWVPLRWVLENRPYLFIYLGHASPACV